MTQCLRERTSLSLSEAKRVVDRVLEGHEVDIVLPPDGDIRQLAHQLRLIGARVTLVSALGDVNSTLLDQQYIDWFEQQLRGALQQPIQPNKRLNAFQQLISQFVETLPSIPKEEMAISWPCSIGGSAMAISMASTFTKTKQRWFGLAT